MKKILSLLVIGVLLLVGIMGCNGSEKSTKIVLGTNAEFPPFEFREKGEITGFDMELATAISKKIGRELEIKDMAFDGLIPALQSNKIDFIAAGMTATDERRKNVNFTKSYYQSSQVIIVNDDNTEIKGVENLEGKKVGVQLGTTGDTEAQKIKDVKLKKYNAAFAGVIELKNKKIDAIILDSEPAANFVRENKGLKILSENLTKEEYAMAVSKKNEKLLKEIDGALKELRENGEYDRLFKKYFSKK